MVKPVKNTGERRLMAVDPRSEPASPPGAKASRRRIGTEEAFAIPEQMAALRAIGESTWRNLDLNLLRRSTDPAGPTYKSLVDLGEERLRVMDENGVDMHLLSLTSPGVQCFDADKACAMASLANDRVAEAVARYPTRFAGLAAFAPQDPKRAVVEMERAVGKLKLHGFILNSHTDGEYMDDRKYWPILEAAEALDRAIYIHPRAPSRSSWANPMPTSAFTRRFGASRRKFRCMRCA